MSPVKTEIKEGKFIEFISQDEGLLYRNVNSQDINPISPTPKHTDNN